MSTTPKHPAIPWLAPTPNGMLPGNDRPTGFGAGSGTNGNGTPTPPNVTALVPLAALPADGMPVVSTNGRDMVVLGQCPDGDISVFTDTGLERASGELLVCEVTQPGRVIDMLRQALAHLGRDEGPAAEDVAQLREQLDAKDRQHRALLMLMRQQLIDTYRDRRISWQTLQQLLNAADMAPYQPRHRVVFTLRGSLQVEPNGHDSLELTRTHVASYLGVDTRDLQALDSTSLTFDTEVHVEHVED